MTKSTVTVAKALRRHSGRWFVPRQASVHTRVGFAARSLVARSPQIVRPIPPRSSRFRCTNSAEVYACQCRRRMERIVWIGFAGFQRFQMSNCLTHGFGCRLVRQGNWRGTVLSCDHDQTTARLRNAEIFALYNCPIQQVSSIFEVFAELLKNATVFVSQKCGDVLHRQVIWFNFSRYLGKCGHETPLRVFAVSLFVCREWLARRTSGKYRRYFARKVCADFLWS